VGKTNEDKLLTFFENLTADLTEVSSSVPHIQAAKQRQLERMRKRAKLPGQDLANAALDKFLKCNAELRDVKITLSSDVIECARDYLLYALEKHCKKYDPDSLQETYTWDQLCDNWAFGPGASNGVQGSGTVSKIDQPMTVTDSARPLLKSLRLRDTYFRCFDAANGNDGLLTVEGSRLTTVPKNETTERTIAIEPSGNMALQLAAGRIIEGCLRMLGLDIKDQQDVNKRLARYASKTGTMCTLDLSMASDRFLPELIRLLWPPEWYDLFMNLRSPSTMVRGRATELTMISTMGNGFTFPMMTMTILMLVYANRRINHGGPYRFVDWSCTGVFGDDIIVPTYEYDSLCERLNESGLLVNHDKSFKAGPFRESCGGDYYEGYNITPFYVKVLNTHADIYTAINQLLKWCGAHALFAPRALKWLVDLLGTKVLVVPEWMQDTSGIRSMRCPRKFKYLKLVPNPVRYSGWSEMRLACGGYLSTKGNSDSLWGMPRPRYNRYELGTARLPVSYLDGWDPSYRTLTEASHACFLLSMVAIG